MANESDKTSNYVGPTITPTPTPFRSIIGLTGLGFNPDDYPGRQVDEVTDIGPKFTQTLTDNKIDSLAKLASTEVECLAKILGISEVRAIGFIYEARALLTNLKIRQ